MRLEGKALIAFEKWYMLTYSPKTKGGHRFYLSQFGVLTESMRYGVYIDWADKVGLYIFTPINKYYLFSIEINGVFDSKKQYKTRSEARTAAVQKLSELYNNQNK